MIRQLIMMILLVLPITSFAIKNTVTNDTDEDVVIKEKVVYGITSNLPAQGLRIKAHQTKSWEFFVFDMKDVFYELLYSIDGAHGLGLIKIDFMGNLTSGFIYESHPYSSYDIEYDLDKLDPNCLSDKFVEFNQCRQHHTVKYNG